MLPGLGDQAPPGPAAALMPERFMTLDQVRRLALSLPEATEEPHFDYTSFRVRGKIFATVPPENEYLHVFVSDKQRGQALAEHPDFLEALVWGGQTRGLRVLLPAARPEAVRVLLAGAWSRKAPKRLLAAADKDQRAVSSVVNPQDGPP